MSPASEVLIGHDFTAEALCIQHNGEIQSTHFGGGARFSIEGYTVHQYPKHMNGSSLIGRLWNPLLLDEYVSQQDF